jgi:hypothetical protein
MSLPEHHNRHFHLRENIEFQIKCVVRPLLVGELLSFKVPKSVLETMSQLQCSDISGEGAQISVWPCHHAKRLMFDKNISATYVCFRE